MYYVVYEIEGWLFFFSVIIANSSFDQFENSTGTHSKFFEVTVMRFQDNKSDSEYCGLKRRHLK